MSASFEPVPAARCMLCGKRPNRCLYLCKVDGCAELIHAPEPNTGRILEIHQRKHQLRLNLPAGKP